MINCNNDLIVCIDNSIRKQSHSSVNRLYEKLFNNIIQKIRNNKEITKEDFDFIESSSSKQKMLIIQEYNKKQKENTDILQIIQSSGLR